MGGGGSRQGVGYWLLKHGTFTVLAGIGLFFLLAWGVVKVTGFRQHQAPVGGGGGVVAPSQAAVAPSAQGAAPAPLSASASPRPSAVVSDNPAFDLTGSGDGCRMHYFQDEQGRTVTLFTLAVDGELITHVSGPDGIGRHDQQESVGVARFTYAFPLGQATDMGAVLYLSDGTSQSCTISAGADAP